MAATAPPQVLHDKSVYILPEAVGEQSEFDRLDEQHAGLQKYFGDELSLAPIGNPKKILELGSGSGAWAIQAAQMYPDAEVIAADIAPLPSRAIPSNVKFIQVDLRKDLPFVSGAFDVVHMRYVLGHVPDGPGVLRRAANLVKPGGWFLIEDVDFFLRSDDMRDDVKRLQNIVAGQMQARGANPQMGHKLEGLLKETGLFSQVSAAQVHSPFSLGEHADYKTQAVGQTMRRAFLQVYRLLTKTMPLLTQEIVDAFEKEVSGPDRSYTLDFYAVSAQRSLSTTV